MYSRAVNMLPNPRNNSNVLLGDKQHVIFVDSNDANKIKQYTDALGTTSLHDSLGILSNTDTSVSEKGKAIGDLILLRHILSGEIQFKEKRLYKLFQTAIGTKFKIANFDDEQYTVPIIKLIDRFLSTNEDIHEIINNPESGTIVPEPLRNDPLGMALFFKYIKRINIENDRYAQAIGIQRKRRNIEHQTDTNVLNMNTFTTLNKSLDDCGICLKPLASAVMGKPIEVCENHHMFHGTCIVKWILNSGSGDKLCPTCRQPISDDTIRQLFQDKNVLDETIEQRFIRNPGFGGGRKRRTLRYKKRKSTRKNMRRK